MDLWNTETPITDIEGLDIDVPVWIDQEITPYDIAAICQGGCASGAYMPAVTYHKALKTMNDHSDEILNYIEECFGEVPEPPSDTSWEGRACYYVSSAVELWAYSLESELEHFELETEEA